MTVEEFLKSIIRMQHLIRSLQMQKKQMTEELMELKGQRYDMPKVGGSKASDISDTVIAIEQKARRYDELISDHLTELFDMRKQGSSMIFAVKDTEIQAILIERYMCGMAWEDIARERQSGEGDLEAVQRYIYRKHRQGMDELEEKYGPVERKSVDNLSVNVSRKV